MRVFHFYGCRGARILPRGFPNNKLLQKPWWDIEVKEELFNEIVGRLANGESLIRVCRDKTKNYPSPASFLSWVSNNPLYLKKYARAAEIRADVNSEIILDAAESEPNPARARNIMDSRKWHNEKMYPRKYGQRILSEGHHDINVKHKIDFTELSQEARTQLRAALARQLHPQMIENES